MTSEYVYIIHVYSEKIAKTSQKKRIQNGRACKQLRQRMLRWKRDIASHAILYKVGTSAAVLPSRFSDSDQAPLDQLSPCKGKPAHRGNVTRTWQLASLQPQVTHTFKCWQQEHIQVKTCKK